MVKNGWEHLDHESLKYGVFLKWFDELNRFTECYLDADSDKIILGLIAYILCIFDK